MFAVVPQGFVTNHERGGTMFPAFLMIGQFVAFIGNNLAFFNKKYQ